MIFDILQMTHELITTRGLKGLREEGFI